MHTNTNKQDILDIIADMFKYCSDEYDATLNDADAPDFLKERAFGKYIAISWTLKYSFGFFFTI